MARDPQAALVALNRFGFGARGGASGDFINAASDPRGFVAAELQRPAAALIESPALQSTSVLASELFTFQAEQKAKREADATAAAAKTAMASPEPSTMMDKAAPTPTSARPPKPAPNVIQRTFRAEALARIQRASIAGCGFVERLVTFWSNHFCISAGKGQPARIWAGAFEREAIRPHVLGRFADMPDALDIKFVKTAFRQENEHLVALAQTQQRRSDRRQKRYLRGLVPQVFGIDQGAVRRGGPPIEPVADLAIGRDPIPGQDLVIAQRRAPQFRAEKGRDPVLVAEGRRHDPFEMLVLRTANEDVGLKGTHIVSFPAAPWRIG